VLSDIFFCFHKDPERLFYPVVTALKEIKFLFSVCKKGLARHRKLMKIRENTCKRVLHAAIEYLPEAYQMAVDCPRSCRKITENFNFIS
jgi:hypothetical protein